MPADHSTGRADWAETALILPVNPMWRLEASVYHLARGHDLETFFAIGNGRLGVRGSLEQPTRASQ